MNKSKLIAISGILGVTLVAFLSLDAAFHWTGGHGRAVDALVAKNIAARGGADNWRAVTSLRLSGQLDLGQGMHVPYVMEQMRPDKMCFEFEFDSQWATQCVDGKSGWKLLPFRGRPFAEPMTEAELREMQDTASIDGLLFDSDIRGHDIDLVGHQVIDGKNVAVLAVHLPNGVSRRVFLDEETGLEIMIEATRIVRGLERRVETVYSDWREVNGLLIPHRQDTKTAGEWDSNFLTIESVEINPSLSAARFAQPVGGNGPQQAR